MLHRFQEHYIGITLFAVFPRLSQLYPFELCLVSPCQIRNCMYIAHYKKEASTFDIAYNLTVFL